MPASCELSRGFTVSHVRCRSLRPAVVHRSPRVTSALDSGSLRPIAVRISTHTRIARGVGVAPISSTPAAPSVAAEVAASGDPNAGPGNANMGPTATEASEVTTGEVGAAKVASSKMDPASVASTSVASASGQGHRRNRCGTTQKESGQHQRRRFSNHQSLLHSSSKHQDRCTRPVFPLLKRSFDGFHLFLDLARFDEEGWLPRARPGQE
jgi:hypothetical protein